MRAKPFNLEISPFGPHLLSVAELEFHKKGLFLYLPLCTTMLIQNYLNSISQSSDWFNNIRLWSSYSVLASSPLTTSPQSSIVVKT